MNDINQVQVSNLDEGDALITYLLEEGVMVTPFVITQYHKHYVKAFLTQRELSVALVKLRAGIKGEPYE
jgi:hypothetical protein